MDLAEIVRWREKLTGRRRRAPRVVVLNPIKPSAADTVAYARSLVALASDSSRFVESILLPFLERTQTQWATDSAEAQDGFADQLRDVFDEFRSGLRRLALERAFRVVSAIFGRVNRKHRERFYRDVEERMGVDVKGIVSEAGLDDTLRLKTHENVALIKSIPEEYLAKVERAVYEAVIQGRADRRSLQERIRTIGRVTERRARFIARDQTAKLVSVLNQERQTALGIEEYRWRTSKDERVRPSHRSKEGKTFRWDQPPADTGHPGHDYGCRCTASPVVRI